MLEKLIEDAQEKGLITIQKTVSQWFNPEQTELDKAMAIMNEFARTMRPLNIFTYTRPTEKLEDVDFGRN